MKEKAHYEKIIRMGFWIVFAVQIFFILLSNFMLIAKKPDGDTSMLYYHIMAMANEKTPVIKDWVYPSTLELDCTTLFALPLYILTRNIYFSCALSNMILLGIFTGIVFYLFGGKTILYPLSAMNLILIPYTSGALEYYNLLFLNGAQYSIKVMIPLLFAALVLHCRKENEGKRHLFRIMAALYAFLLFLSCFSSGSYVVLCGIFPVLVAYACLKFLRTEKVTGREITLVVTTFICGTVGILCNSRSNLLEGEDKIYVSVYDIWSNISKCFFGIFEIMGGATRSDHLVVTSFTGLRLLVAMLFTMVLVCVPIAVLIRLRKKENDFGLLLSSVALWNFLILCITQTRYGSLTFEYRYHLLGMIPVICIFANGFWDFISEMKEWQKHILAAAGILFVIFMSLSGYRTLFYVDGFFWDVEEIAAYRREQGVERVYYVQNNQAAEISRVIDPDGIYLGIRGDGTSFVRDYYRKYQGLPLPDGNYYVIVDYGDFPWEEEVDYNGVVMLERVKTIGTKGIYQRKE